MRPVLLIVGTVLVLGVVFGLYMATQQRQAAVPQLAAQAAPPQNVPTQPLASEQQLHAGEDAFFQVIDKVTGEVTSQYRAHQYDPQPPDGRVVLLTLPEADFFMADGQVMKIRGHNGRVVMAAGAAQAKSVGASQTPSRGALFDVTLQMFRTKHSKQPFETCVVDNLQFDNDTFMIAAGPILDAAGNVVTPAERVPVTIRGDDYDFDGQGLIIKWDERDRHLRLLQVEHGNRLVIKHPGSATVSAPGFGAMATLVPAPVGPLAGALASADPRAGLMAAHDAETEPTTAATEPVVRAQPYEATFDRNVVVTQAQETLATGDRMDVDFISKSGASGSNAAAAPDEPAARTAQPVTRPAGSAPADLHANSHTPAAQRPAPPQEAEAHPSTAPDSTQPSPPLIITWTGRLVVSPFVAGDLNPGDSIVQMSSDRSQVVLNRQGSHARCASFRYHTVDDSLTMTSSQYSPMVQIDSSDGAHITTPSLQYDGATRRAELEGAGHAVLPIQNKTQTDAATPATAPATQPTTQPTTLDATWSRLCTLVFGGPTRRALQIQHATLDGDVHVEHPQLTMRAGSLDLTFDPPTTQPAMQPVTVATTATAAAPRPRPTSQPVLRSLEATEDVDCRIKDSSGGKDESIRCRHLLVQTVPDASGNASPRQLSADGDVCAADPDQQLSSQELVAILEPTTRPATRPAAHQGSQSDDASQDVQLKSLVAQRDVQFRAKDGSGADAQKLTIDVTPQGRQVQLVGNPTAEVHDKNGTVWGSTIWFDEASQQTRINGAGHGHFIQQASPGATTRPADVSWTKGLFVDGASNHALVDGNVVVSSIDSDGSHDAATGDRLVMLLADAPPTTQPSTQPTNTRQAASPTTRPAKGFSAMAGNNVSFMKNKVLREMHLIGVPMEGRSVLTDAASGKQLRRMYLFAPELVYDPPTRSMVVPDPGRLLVQDNRPSTKAPATQAASNGIGGGRGATAFRWSDRLTYDDVLGRVTMLGDVMVVHESPEAERYELHAHSVSADLDRTKPATQPATGPAGTGKSGQHRGASTQPSSDSARLRRLTAEGLVHLTSGRLNFDAETFEYNPTTNIIIATAPLRRPAHLLDEQGVSTGTFTYLRYNTLTEQVESIHDFHVDMRNR